MIRGMERGLQVFLDETYQVLVDDIRANLNPRTAPTTRETFKSLVEFLEFRSRRYATECLSYGEPRTASQAYIRALNELRDEISLWLEPPQEKLDA